MQSNRASLNATRIPVSWYPCSWKQSQNIHWTSWTRGFEGNCAVSNQSILAMSKGSTSCSPSGVYESSICNHRSRRRNDHVTRFIHASMIGFDKSITTAKRRWKPELPAVQHWESDLNAYRIALALAGFHKDCDSPEGRAWACAYARAAAEEKYASYRNQP